MLGDDAELPSDPDAAQEKPEERAKEGAAEGIES
jgi:hypothetical protein